MLVVLHAAFGYLMLNRTLSKSLNILIFCIAFWSILSTKNKNEEAALWSGYMVGAEVLFRMSKGLLFYEFPKYSVFILLFTGLLIEKRRHPISPVFIIYVLLLLFGITFSDIPYPESIRTNIIFNLSGPILLGMCAMYMYKRRFTKDQLLNLLRYMGLPIVTMMVYIYFKVPDLQFVQFGGVSNRVTSGGYGPNQVSTILGVGIFIYALHLIVKKRFSGYFLIDVALLLYVSYRCLITLSRGGLITSVLAVTAFAGFYFLSRKNTWLYLIKYFFLLFMIVVPLFMYTAMLTGGMLVNRYTNKNARGVEKTDVTAGRVEIATNEFEGFLENPFFGIGVGSGKFKRIDELGYKAASHNELSRLLGEHGAVGLIIIFMLIFVPIVKMNRQVVESRAFLGAFLVFWFLTINHSAMRLAMPSFMYGLSVMYILRQKDIVLVSEKKGDG